MKIYFKHFLSQHWHVAPGNDFNLSLIRYQCCMNWFLEWP